MYEGVTIMTEKKKKKKFEQDKKDRQGSCGVGEMSNI